MGLNHLTSPPATPASEAPPPFNAAKQRGGTASLIGLRVQ